MQSLLATWKPPSVHPYSRPLIPLLICLIAGIFFGFWFPGYRILTYVVVAVCLGLTIGRIRQRHTAILFPLIFFLFLGYLSIQPWAAPRFPSRHITHFLDNHQWKIVGFVDTTPVRTGKRTKFIVKIETLEEDSMKKSKPFPVLGKILVTMRKKHLKIDAGDRISLTGTIRMIRNFSNPGGFNYRRYMAYKGIWGTSYVSKNQPVKIENRTDKGINRMVKNVRHHISSFIEQSHVVRRKKGTKGILKALILGDRNDIPQNLREAFHRAGVGHILAISGLHIGIVASTAFLLFSRVLSYVKPLLWNGWTRKGAAILSSFPVVAYGLLSGMSPSTQRAVIMVSLFLLTFLFEREHDLMNTLALAAMLILILHPPALFSISFQLSFSAVLSIVYGLSQTKNFRLQKKNSTLKKRLSIRNKFFTFMLVSFFAIIGTFPLMMLYFNQVSTVGLLVNLLIIPMVGFMVIPLGLVSVVLSPLSVTGASILLNMSAAILSVALNIITVFSKLPFAAVKTVTPSFFEITCFYLVFWAILNIKDQNAPSGFGWWKKFMSKKRLAQAAVVIVIVAGGVDVFYWLNHRFWHRDFRVTIIDVGQGSAALLELPGGYNLLVDGGGFSDPTAFDVGANIIAPFLWRKKIKTVDTLVLSHPNSDHMNGLLYIARYFNVKNVWSTGESSSVLNYHKFRKIIEKKDIQLTRFKPLLQTQHINGVQFKILYPPSDFINRKKTEKWRNYNNNSLVLKVRFGSQTFLFPGDIMARAERELVEISGDELKSRVLIAPHHGSRTSSTDRFLDSVQPEVVIISSGWQNSEYFPHPHTLKRYKKRGYRIFRTSGDGAVAMSTDGRSLKIIPTLAAR
ncbi:MAG: DNA internalization-related competence protein ComEC/Rec2 [Desulfobacterales bacterium]|jgi:competence protein ComEC|nr:DNA internalization-related competence protein ComEC/Rec2 [Desulfobacterales bacterium]MDP6808606.1 DNA internalization-related competence protein ComEC/Rec2 [Desulfobacterales bacterium]|tara:strand:- start:23582 stop:26134 length:2553 start_codon:yes stop_codon:yes gene_type:complete